MHMEFASGGSDGHGVKEEKRSESSTVGDEEGRLKQEETIVQDAIQEPPMTNIERSMLEAGPCASPTKNEEADAEIENTKAEMGEAREENQRLKMCLNRILKDYQTLQMQFHCMVRQETKNSSEKANNNHQEGLEESELVSLSLGRLPSNSIRNNEKAKVSKLLKEGLECKEDLALGLDCKIETSNSGSITENLTNPTSPDNTCEVPMEEARDTWPPNKLLKTNRDSGEDEVSQQNPAKKVRVCVRARCDTPTINDGCQWRKYGQKISKGNPCPRAYYRCTVAPSCPVRKLVQRCFEDTSILITTYEGTHNHPLPLSATAMASTTSAAASMLLSGSSTTTSVSNNLHGLNLYLSEGSKSKQFYYLCNNNPALSSSSHPTITLDLTSNGKFSSNFNTPRYPSSCTSTLNFSSSESNAMSWISNNGPLSYNSGAQPYHDRNFLSTMNLGKLQPMENMYQPCMQRNINSIAVPSQQGALHSLNVPGGNIAAATKVIAADPNFQSALAAAITSVIATGSTKGNNQGVGENNLDQKMKSGEVFPGASSSTLSSTLKINGCQSSFLNKTN